MNNPTASHDTEIVTWSSTLGANVHYTLGDVGPTVIDLDIADIRGLSDSGSFCGYRKIRKNKQNGYLFDGVITNLPEVEWAEAVNADEDVLGTTSGRRPVLYHKTHGTLYLNDLAVAADSFDEQLWTDGTKNFNEMSERNVIGTDPSVADFPAVFGSLRRYDTELSFHYDVYVLLPIPVP